MNGYTDEEDVPEYRKVGGAPIRYNSISGNTYASGLTISRIQLPSEALEYVPAEFTFRQPVEELEQYAAQETLSFRSPGLAYAEHLWNQKLDMFQSVNELHYTMTGSTVAGMLGQIRTKLVDFVAELTASTPLTDLPDKDRVDAAVHERLGDVYNTTVVKADGPLAIGRQAEAKSQGLTVDDALRLLTAVRETAAASVAASDRAELDAAVSDLQNTLEQVNPETGEIVRKAGRLRRAAQKLGVLAVTAATTTAVDTMTELAVNGAFH